MLGRTSQEKLYSEEDASMDSLTTFDPSETVSHLEESLGEGELLMIASFAQSGFITINAIRLKKVSRSILSFIVMLEPEMLTQAV